MEFGLWDIGVIYEYEAVYSVKCFVHSILCQFFGCGSLQLVWLYRGVSTAVFFSISLEALGYTLILHASYWHWSLQDLFKFD
jgi:hypothetical protein